VKQVEIGGDVTIDEGLSLREAVEWCGSGALTVREVTRLRQLAHNRRTAAADERATRPPALAICSAIRAATLVGVAAARSAFSPTAWFGGADAFTCRAATDKAPARWR
jgi:hypothetical protein